jgi:pimeloyl-ACP methyl ester carboxylesterase
MPTSLLPRRSACLASAWMVLAAAQPLAAFPGPIPAYPHHQDPMQLLLPGGSLQPIRSLLQWKQRRGHILGSLQQVMGRLPDRSQQVPSDVRIHETRMIGPLGRSRLSFRSDTSGRVTAFVFFPAPSLPPVRHPAVLCLQQTNREGKLEAAGISGNPELAHALHLARRGYVTMAPDYPGFGESTYDFKPRHGYASGTMKAIWDNIRAVDVLSKLKRVDPARIGVIGHSLGGHNAMFTAAFEPRLRVIVSSCGFTRFHKDDVPSWTGPRYMPRIRTRFGNSADRVPFDFPEIIGMLAPRPFLAIAAKRDRDFDYTGVLDSIDAARPVYGLHAASGSLQAAYPDLKHSFPASSRSLADRFLDRHLRHVPTQ